MSLDDELVAERYGENRWWTRRPRKDDEIDNEIACARRRRELDAEMHERRASA